MTGMFAVQYDKEDFEKENIHHYDLFFEDCTVPRSVTSEL
jgi:hypothetical protein